MKATFCRPHILSESIDTNARWQVRIRIMPGNWMTRELPDLPDGELLAFIANVARRNKQMIALTFEDEFTLWFGSNGQLSHITERGNGSPPYMTADDSDEAFVWQSDLEPEEKW